MKTDNTHDIIAKGIAKELGLKSTSTREIKEFNDSGFNSSQQDWYKWEIGEKYILAAITNGKVFLGNTHLGLGNITPYAIVLYDLADPNLIEQLQQTLEDVWKVDA